MPWDIAITRETSEELIEVKITFGETGLEYDRHKSFERGDVPHQTVLDEIDSESQFISIVYIKSGNTTDTLQLQLDDFESIDPQGEPINGEIIVYDETNTTVKSKRRTKGQVTNEIGS